LIGEQPEGKQSQDRRVVPPSGAFWPARAPSTSANKAKRVSSPPPENQPAAPSFIAWPLRPPISPSRPQTNPSIAAIRAPWVRRCPSAMASSFPSNRHGSREYLPPGFARGACARVDPRQEGLAGVQTERPTEESVPQWAVGWPGSLSGYPIAASISRGHPLALLAGLRGTAEVGQGYRERGGRVKDDAGIEQLIRLGLSPCG